MNKQMQMVMTPEHPTRYTNHVYQAVDLAAKIPLTFQSTEFPEITKMVRKRVKLRHGNRLRTILLEEGVVHAEGYDRNDRRDKDGNPIYYNFEITIHRW